ncbi:hypothetical protein PP707_08190 [Acetobacter pasteurianus]|nr:hypothetical protein [Acetobacter pasteurianus]
MIGGWGSRGIEELIAVTVTVAATKTQKKKGGNWEKDAFKVLLLPSPQVE